MKQDFEIVSYGATNLKILFANILYRTPHVHKDFEFGYVLDHDMDIMIPGQTYSLHPGDMWITNPFQSHEIKAKRLPSLSLIVQIPASFFMGFYKQIDNLEFTDFLFSKETHPMNETAILPLMLQMAAHYFRTSEFYEIKCAALLNECLFQLLTFAGYRFVSEKERLATKAKAVRMRSILQYIDDNYHGKLLLSDIAQHEDLSLYYLSHLFKSSLGMPFQEYLLRFRCEKARCLLLSTDHSLLDISIDCGFSDLKYLNSGFLRQYNYTPKEYRSRFARDELYSQPESMTTPRGFVTTEYAIGEILSAKSSLLMLERLQKGIGV